MRRRHEGTIAAARIEHEVTTLTENRMLIPEAVWHGDRRPAGRATVGAGAAG